MTSESGPSALRQRGSERRSRRLPRHRRHRSVESAGPTRALVTRATSGARFAGTVRMIVPGHLTAAINLRERRRSGRTGRRDAGEAPGREEGIAPHGRREGKGMTGRPVEAARPAATIVRRAERVHREGMIVRREAGRPGMGTTGRHARRGGKEMTGRRAAAVRHVVETTGPRPGAVRHGVVRLGVGRREVGMIVRLHAEAVARRPVVEGLPEAAVVVPRRRAAVAESRRLITALLASALFAAGAVRVEHVAGGHGAAVDVPARDIRLTEPFAVDFGRNGEWFICEYKGQRIVRVYRDGRTAVFAGTGEQGNSGDGGNAAQATFRDPHGIAITKNGMMYVADTLNHTVRRINLTSRTITTVAGTGEKGFSGDGGPATKATFNGTFGIALHPAGDRLYIADLFNRRVRLLDLRDGTVRTVAGNGEKGVPVDGAPAASSPLVDPRAVAVDSKGNLYILERSGNALRVVNQAGAIRTLIAPGTVQPDLNGPKHLCTDKRDRVIIADAENHLIRLYDPKSGKTVTLAGTGHRGDRIDSNDPLKTELNRSHGVSIDPSGALFITDSYNHRILRITGY